MRISLFALLAAVACATPVDLPPGLPVAGADADSLVLIAGGDVIPMDGAGVLEDHSVLVREGRIVAVAPVAELPAPPGARVVDASGRWVIPGLIDMHVHINEADLEAYVDHGITTVRNMWGFAQLAAIIDRVASGRVRGPEIHSLSSGFDGSPIKWPQTQLVDDLSRIEPLIEAQVAQGYTEIKMYRDLSLAAYDSIVAVARNRGLTFAGHVPIRVGLDHVLARGQRSIEHLGGYDPARLDVQVPATVAAGAWNCPTLAIQGPASVRPRLAVIVGALHAGGARILAGTDAGIGRTAPGASMADELALLVAAGLSPADALRAATTSAAEYLGLEGEIGVIAPGARADLVILDGNPLEDVGAVRLVRGVVLRGVFGSAR